MLIIVFTPTAFETLLFQSRSVVEPSQQILESEGVKILLKNQKPVWLC